MRILKGAISQARKTRPKLLIQIILDKYDLLYKIGNTVQYVLVRLGRTPWWHSHRDCLFVTRLRRANLKTIALQFRPCLLAEIRRVSPEIIVLMGKVAQKVPCCNGIWYIETYHPAAAMRFPEIKRRFEEAFQAINIKK
ncbi:MAG: hypothetical protein Q8O43_08495 [Dehalococcoidia bacterium]|nr:hypothetical protein [Dehalococcoidia bacterium]